MPPVIRPFLVEKLCIAFSVKPTTSNRWRPRAPQCHHPPALQALSAIRPAGVASDEKVFGLSESQIARRVKVIAKAAGLADWELFSGHSGRVGMARAHGPERRSHPRDRATGPLEAGRRHGRALPPAANPPGRRCDTCDLADVLICTVGASTFRPSPHPIVAAQPFGV